MKNYPKKLYVFFLFGIFYSLNSFTSDFGTTGLLDMPSARMLNDGDFKVTISNQDVSKLINLTYQATPWFETTFRYDTSVHDRSYEGKLQLMTENKYRPSVAVGVRDIIGTGLWNGEYLVGTKKIDNFDFTLGIGWGRYSERATFSNPLKYLNDKFEKRVDALGQYGGSVGGKSRASSFFKGEDIGLFGGFTYDIDKYNLRLIAEYNSDSYKREIAFGQIKDSSPMSFGLEWEVASNTKIGLSYQHGNEIAFSLSSLVSTKFTPTPKQDNYFYSSADTQNLSGASESLDLTSWYHRLLYDMERSGILLLNAGIDSSKNKLVLEISNLKYELISDAIGRAYTLANIHSPKTVNSIIININENQFKTASLSLDRRYLTENKSTKYYNDALIPIVIGPTDNSLPISFLTEFPFPSILFNYNLAERVQLFDPDKSLRHQLYLNISTNLRLSDKWSIWGIFSQDINNTFDTNRKSDSVLPRVRSDINYYLDEGATGIQALFIEKKDTLKQDFYYRTYAGLLEDMFAGIGGEILFQPYAKRWAMGLSVDAVKQRGYERNFDMKDYEVLTAFLSGYYASPLYNFDLALHIGQYLAEDRGATLEIRRSFDNGFSIGAFATLTNVSSKDFGEGSFDKGLSFTIPFNSFVKTNTKNKYITELRSVQRDGGQRLNGYGGKLWHSLRNVRFDRLDNNKYRMLPK